MPKLTISSNYVDSNRCTHLPESTLFSSKGLRIWPLLQPERNDSVAVWGGGSGVAQVCLMAGSVGRRICFIAFGEGKHEMGGGGRCMCIVYCANSSPTRPGRFTLMTEGRGGARVAGLNLKILCF
jgi:hypothetical protein